MTNPGELPANFVPAAESTAPVKIPIDAANWETITDAMSNVPSPLGTAGSAHLQGIDFAGKTGTAQNTGGADHGWFVGFAPADKPKIVVAVLLEFGLHGSRAAHIASAIIGHYLKVGPIKATQ